MGAAPGAIFYPTNNLVERMYIGKGEFIVCSEFCGSTTISVLLAERMLADIRDGSFEMDAFDSAKTEAVSGSAQEENADENG